MCLTFPIGRMGNDNNNYWHLLHEVEKIKLIQVECQAPEEVLSCCCYCHPASMIILAAAERIAQNGRTWW